MKCFPDYLTKEAKETLQKMGPFDYDKYKISNPPFQPILGPYLLKVGIDKGHVYKGQWLNGKRHGRGKLLLKSGRVYEGNWQNGVGHGKGRMIQKKGRVYEGDWVND